MSDPSRKSRWLLSLGVVTALAAGTFGFRLDSEPFFADESAHIAQTYYYRLVKDGNVHDVDWVHVAAYDHTPIYKYWIGAYFDLVGNGDAIPTSTEPWERWMLGQFDAPQSAKTLRDARISMLLGAVLGCILIFVLASQTVGPKTGVIAALLLLGSPLYYTHARRAMADDLTQAFVLGTFVGYVWLVRSLQSPLRRYLQVFASLLLTGLAGGLAIETKLNGVTAFLAIAAFIPVVLLSGSAKRHTNTTVSKGKVVLFTTLALVLSAVVFVVSNPYFYAQPTLVAGPNEESGVKRSPELRAELQRVAELGILGRVQNLLEHRTAGLQESMPRFQEYALPTISSRATAIVREGVGRWSVFGRFTPPPAVGIALGSALVAWGLFYLTLLGWKQHRQGEVPLAWLFVLWPVIETVMLLRTLMLDWDRYYMGVVTWTAFLAAVALGGTMNAIRNRLILRPPTTGGD